MVFTVWNIFFSICGVTIFAYLFMLYFLMAFKHKDYKKPYLKPFSVVIPCYNEEPNYLRASLNSILNAWGNKKIILVNDGSTKKETLDVLKEYRGKIKIVDKENGGLVSAHVEGLKYVDTEVIIFTDSDTIVDKFAFFEVLKPFNNPKIGGATGNMKLANRKQNFLTRVISPMYYAAFNIKRGATGNIGKMYNCSGGFCAFKTEIVKKLAPHYANQKFLGRKAGDFSNDAYLTLRTQYIFKKKVAYQKKAIVYTYTPFKLNTFLKQLKRWKKGEFKETIQLLKANKKGNRFLFYDTWYNLFISVIVKFVIIAFMIYLLVLSFTYFLIYLGFTFVWVIIMCFLFNIQIFFEDKKEFFYSFLYSIGYETIFWVAIIPALIGIRNQTAWGTR